MQDASQPNSSPATFGSLAKRISAWTTRGVLSALVLVVGLGFGREVVQWWRSEAVTPNAGETPLALNDALGDLTQAHDLQFGDLPWQFSRQSLSGSKEEVLLTLREVCRESVLAESPIGDLPGPAEKKLLERLHQQNPVAEERGWQLYELAGNCPMVALTRELVDRTGQGSETAQPEGLSPDGSESGSPNQDPHVAPKARRVVTWGLAVPIGEQTWNLYTFAATGKAQSLGPNLPEISLPSESRRILSMRVAGGGAMVSFRGDARPEHWQHFFDDWFQQREWTAEAPWPSSGPAWHRRYTSTGAQPGQAVEVYFRRDRHEQLTGLLILN